MIRTSGTRLLTMALVLGATLTFIACEDSSTPPVIYHPPHGEFAFVTTTDYSTGAGSIVFADTLYQAVNNVASIHADALARAYDRRIYVLNRQGADNIQVLDPAAGFATIKQFSVGNGADPEDIVFQSRSRAFVSRYNEDQLWIVNPNSGQRSGQIDFSWLADSDLIPEMSHMAMVGTRIFVAIQRLDRNTPFHDPTGTSYVAVFDASTEQFYRNFHRADLQL